MTGLRDGGLAVMESDEPRVWVAPSWTDEFVARDLSGWKDVRDLTGLPGGGLGVVGHKFGPSVTATPYWLQPVGTPIMVTSELPAVRIWPGTAPGTYVDLALDAYLQQGSRIGSPPPLAS